MPTDFSHQFKHETFPKKKTEQCSWSKHLQKGSGLREVVRALEFLAKKNTDRYVFASPKALCAQINRRGGSYRKGAGAGKPLSLSTVEKCLALLQQLQILSPTLRHSPDSKQPTPGWVLAPHDDCCNTYAKRCAFIGPGKKGHWVTTPYFVWLADAFVDIEFEDGQLPGAFVVPEQENKQ